MLNTHGTFADLIGSVLGVFNVIIPVLVAGGLVFMFYGIVQYIYTKGKHNGMSILWSLVALFVALSIWGILRILSNTFGVR